MELGIYTFGEMSPDPKTGRRDRIRQQRFRNLMEEVELADQVGLDVFGIGEHHRPDFAVSAPAVVLAAAATRTKRIRLTSAVTVLSSDDPVRVFQEFATARPHLQRPRRDHGRARLVHRVVPALRLRPQRLRLAVRREARSAPQDPRRREGDLVGQASRRRSNNLGVYPRPVQNPLPVWIAVGGTPQSVVRAGTLGLPMALAIIGGEPERFAPLVDLYREAARARRARSGEAPGRHQFARLHRRYVAAGGRRGLPAVRRGDDPDRPRARLAADDAGAVRCRRARSAARLSSAARSRWSRRSCSSTRFFGHHRFLIQFSVGALPHTGLMHSIELFGTKVAPAVRKALAGRGRRPTQA